MSFPEQAPQDVQELIAVYCEEIADLHKTIKEMVKRLGVQETENASLKSQLEQAQKSLRKAKEDLHMSYCEGEDEDSPVVDFRKFKEVFPNLYEHKFKHIEEALK
jgi:regulator of replication initiation timing